MRALRHHGWINFRMRAMLMSVASYQLWLPWRQSGEALARLFVDYEPGIHWNQCQMQSGTSGINTVRIYNPIKQGLDHDPEGTFTRQWLPELQEVPVSGIHTPWLLAQPPENYPNRLLITRLPHDKPETKFGVCARSGLPLRSRFDSTAPRFPAPAPAKPRCRAASSTWI